MGARFAAARGRGFFTLTLAAFLVALPDAASGAQAARLVYSRNAGASACPDEGDLRQAVQRRLGYDPFVAYSQRTMVVELRGDTSGLTAHLYMVDPDNVAGGIRELASPAPDCKELISAVALAISIAIDPDAIDRLEAAPSPAPDDANIGARPPTEEPPSIQPSAPSPKRDARPVVTPPAEESTPSGPKWSVGVGPAIASGPAPAPQFEVALLLGLRGEHWAATLEPRMSFPTSTDARPGEVETAAMGLYGATLSPCYRYGPLLGCYLFDGALAVSTGKDVQHPRTDRSFWWAMGLRAGVRWEVGRGLGVSGRLDGLWAPEQIVLRLNGQDVFETPQVLARFGAFVDYEF